jgi:hypothetical protein
MSDLKREAVWRWLTVVVAATSREETVSVRNQMLVA